MFSCIFPKVTICRLSLCSFSSPSLYDVHMRGALRDDNRGVGAWLYKFRHVTRPLARSLSPPTEEKNDALSITTQDMKLAIVALDLGKDSLITVNCAANSVIQVPTLLFQTDLVPDGRAGE